MLDLKNLASPRPRCVSSLVTRRHEPGMKMKMRDDKALVRPTSRKESAEEKCDLTTDDVDLLP